MEQEDLKKYQETVSEIKKLFEWDLALKKVFGPRVDLVKGVFELMQRQMNELAPLAKGETIEVSDEEKSRVKEVVNLFYNIAINEPIVDIFRDLSGFYLRLVFNWNKELGKRPDIENQISTAQKIVDMQQTVVEATSLLKYQLKRDRDMRNFNPPAFEMSRHYLETLNKE